jgi:hypothetical protein
MTSPDDPLRLADGGGDAPEALRELLAGARRDGPTSGQLQALSAALPFLAPPSGAPAPAAASGAIGKSLVALVVAGVLVGGGVWLGRGEPPPPVPREPMPQQTAAPIPAPAPTSAPASASAQARPEPTPRAGPTEATLLRQAQAALRRDPAQALALTREHRRRFPKGALAQEREVIAIEALSRLGRSGEASKAATDFTQRYPDSAHRRKVEATTGGTRSP